MRRCDFQFNLPPELIAQAPCEQRSASRLLCLDRCSGEVSDKSFQNFPDYLRSGDLLVLNNTRVIPARLYGRKVTGGKVEILLERVLDDTHIRAQIRASKSPKLGSDIFVGKQACFCVLSKNQGLYDLIVKSDIKLEDLLQQEGHMPLPPYIDRQDTPQDIERYQTIYASRAGAVAAPTAGLHFDDHILEQLRKKGVNIGYVTLHVAAGTFTPVRVEQLEDHKMHSEWIEVDSQVCDLVNNTKIKGGRVFAVGTTSVRCLETVARNGKLEPYSGETNIFIWPGYQFQLVDALLTNFHLSESTLLMLVSAFAGSEHIKAAYQHAIAQRYRFFSYGDAMLIVADQ